LREKYKIVEELIDEMKKDNSRKRPDCEKILERRRLWALSKSDFNYENELKSIEKTKNENYFVYNVMISKLCV